jgi:hypothetical protein
LLTARRVVGAETAALVARCAQAASVWK